MIYEGTNGIQSIDLLGRKLTLQNGLGYEMLKKKMKATIEEAQKSSNPALREAAALVHEGVERHISVTEGLLETNKGNPAALLANSHEYLNFTGHVVVAWIWLRQGLAAANGLQKADLNDRDECFYNGKLMSMKYFCEHELVKTESQATLLRRNPSTNLDMKNNYF